MLKAKDPTPKTEDEIRILHKQIKELEKQILELSSAQNMGRAYQVIAENTSNSALVMNTNGEALWVNSSFERLSGRTAEEVIGKTTGQFLDGPDTDLRTIQDIWKAMTKGESFACEIIHYNTEKEPYHILATGEPIFLSDKSLLGYAIIETDVTLIKDLEKSLSDAYQSAEKKEIAKKNLLANLSHEFRTPLNGLMGLAELLLTTELDEEQLEYVEMIQISGETLSNHIENLLSLEETEEQTDHELELIFLDEKLPKCLSPLQAFAKEKNISLAIIIDASLPTELFLPWHQLSMVLRHLVDNGIKFTNQGKVEIILSNTYQSKIEIAVKDTGVGICELKLPFIFEAYYLGDASHTRKYGGIGLGLTLAQRMVESFGSTIEVESVLNEGTTMTFQVPFKLAE